MKDIKLIEIGAKVKDSIEAVWALGLSLEELETLEAFVDQQEALVPLLNPNLIQKHGFKLFDQAKRRIELLKPILELQELEKEGKIKK